MKKREKGKGRNVPNEKKRRNVVAVILDRYEEHSSDWKKYGDEGAAGRRSVFVEQELYDEIGRQELIAQIVELSKKGLLDVKWYQTGSEVECFIYRLEDMNAFYALDGRRPKRELAQARLKELEELIGSREWKPWLLDSLEELRKPLEAGKIPRVYEKKEYYLKALAGLNQLNEPIYKRVFSKHFLGKSKVFENDIQGVVISAARRFHPDVDSDPEVMSAEEVLSQIFVETYSQELWIKGPLRLQVCGKVSGFSEFPFGVGLNADMLKNAEICQEQDICKVVTVENKANFMKMPYEEGALLVYTHGFFSPKERFFLKKLETVLKKKRVEYFHTGDLDYGGIRIFQHIQKNIFPKLQPLWMDEETFLKYAEEAAAVEEAYLEKLRKLSVPETLERLKKCILETGKVIEQECMLWKE